MARKKRFRKARGSRPSKRYEEPTYLLSVGFGDSDSAPCECPICKVLNIDMNDANGLDIRPVTQEQLAQIEQYMARLE